MLANEIEGATSSERLGDLERLGDHLTWVEARRLGEQSGGPSMERRRLQPFGIDPKPLAHSGLCLLSRPPETTPS